MFPLPSLDHFLLFPLSPSRPRSLVESVESESEKRGELGSDQEAGARARAEARREKNRFAANSRRIREKNGKFSWVLQCFASEIVRAKLISRRIAAKESLSCNLLLTNGLANFSANCSEFAKFCELFAQTLRRFPTGGFLGFQVFSSDFVSLKKEVRAPSRLALNLRQWPRKLSMTLLSRDSVLTTCEGNLSEFQRDQTIRINSE